MTFRDISYKMFKKNFRRYFLFFLCSTLTIMVFFAFSTIFTNDAFMRDHKVNSTISSMIIAPSIGVVAFSIFFITYAQTCFTKYRKPDFGLFMTLGMTNNDIAKIMLIENSLIGGMALIAGIFCGIIFSRLLGLMIAHIIDLNGITFDLSYKSFLYTISFFFGIYAVSTITSLIASRKYEILVLLQETKQKDKNRFRSEAFAGLSIVLILIAILDGAMNINVNNQMALVRSVTCFFLGSYFLITNIGLLVKKLLRRSKGQYHKNLLFLTNLEHSLGQSKKIMLAIMILVSIIIFFANVPIGLLYNAKNTAVENNPHDISYYQIMGRNRIAKEKLEDILKNGQTELTDQKSISLIDYRRIFLFSDKELNQKLNTNFHVEEGSFLNLFNENIDDGYKHSIEDVKDLNIQTEKGSMLLKNQGRHIGVIFTPTPAAYNYLILNEMDYNKVKRDIRSTNLGALELFSFRDWEKTENIANNLTDELRKYNESLGGTYFTSVERDRFVFKPRSKIGLYNENVMGGRALLVYHSFVGILFFTAAGIMLHFKQMIEFEGEKKKYNRLYKIGIADWEIEKVVAKELMVLFFAPQALAIVVAVVYSSIMPLYLEGQGSVAVLFALGIGIFYLGFQYAFYITYKKYYVKNFFN